jgi:hypothetical protein
MAKKNIKKIKNPMRVDLNTRDHIKSMYKRKKENPSIGL